MWPVRDFDLLGQLEMVAATACGILVVFVIVGALILFAGYLHRIGRDRWLNKL